MPLGVPIPLAQQLPLELSLTQQALIGLGLIVVFVCSIITANITAKKIAVPEADGLQALLAIVLKNIGFGLSVAVGMQVPAIPPMLFFILGAVVFPVAIYKLVFSSTVPQAIKIWIVVLIVEGLVGVGIVVGILNMGSTP